MRVGLAGAWTVSDDVCDGLDAQHRVLGPVTGPGSLSETGSPTNPKIKLIGTNAVLKQRFWYAYGLGGCLDRLRRCLRRCGCPAQGPGSCPWLCIPPWNRVPDKLKNKTHRYKRCIETEVLVCVWAWRVPGSPQTMPATVWMPRAGSWELSLALHPSLKQGPWQVEK